MHPCKQPSHAFWSSECIEFSPHTRLQLVPRLRELVAAGAARATSRRGHLEDGGEAAIAVVRAEQPPPRPSRYVALFQSHGVHEVPGGEGQDVPGASHASLSKATAENRKLILRTSAKNGQRLYRHIANTQHTQHTHTHTLPGPDS